MKISNKYIVYAVLFLLFLSHHRVYSDDFVTSGITAEKFPTIQVPFVVWNNNGTNQKNISPTDFNIKEDGKLIPHELIGVTCAEYGAPIQLLFMIDQSTSMGEEYNGRSKMEWVAIALNSFFQSLNMSWFSEIGISTFCANVTQVIDFTNDIDALKAAVNNIRVETSLTNFNVAFLYPKLGAIDALKEQANINRIVVFLSDGKHTPSLGNLETSIIASGLKNNHITLYSYIVSDETDISISAIRDISNATGGFCQRDIVASSLPNMFIDLAKKITNQYNCVLTWKSPLYCDAQPKQVNASIEYIPTKQTSLYTYTAPAWSVFKVTGAENVTYNFGDPALNSSSEKMITITPSPWDMTIKNIYIDDTDYFEISDYSHGSDVKPTKDILIPANTSRTFKVRFTQSDYYMSRKANLIIEAEPCDRAILLYGGKARIDAWVDAESYISCDNVTVTWSGVPSNSKKELYYNVNAGSWQLIEAGIQGDSYQWQPPKITATIQMKVVAYPLEGFNDNVSASTEKFKITYPKLSMIQQSLVCSDLMVGKTKIETFKGIFTNNLTTPFKIINATITGENPNNFKLITDLSGTYQLRDTADIEIEFLPDILDLCKADLNLILECGDNITLTLFGSGVCGFNSIDEVDFGNVLVNTPRDTVVLQTIENPLDIPLKYSIRISGNDFNMFKVLGIEEKKEYILGGKKSLDVRFRFLPTSLGRKDAILNVILKDCADINIPLRGNSVTQAMEINEVDFGRERLKYNFKQQAFTIENKDNYNKEISSIEFVNQTTTEYFTVPVTFPIPINGNQSISIPVQFNPDMTNTDTYFYDVIVLTNMRDTLYSSVRGETYLPELLIETECPDWESGNGMAILRLINTSTSEPVTIHSATILEGNDEFAWITKPSTDQQIAINGGSEEYQLYFTPQDNAPHSFKIRIEADNYAGEYQGQWLENIAELQCDALFIEYTKPEFDNVLVCENQESYFKVRNKSETIELQLFCNQMSVTGNDNTNFTLQTQDTVTIASNSEKELGISFIPSHAGEHIANISIPNSTGTLINLPVTGIGQVITPSANPQHLKYNPRDTMYVAFKINTPPTYLGYIDSLEMRIKFDPNLMYPFEKTFKTFLSKNSNDNEYFIIDTMAFVPGGEIYLKAHCNLLSEVEYKLCSLYFLGLIAANDSAAIDVEIYYPCLSEQYTVSTVKRNDVCAENISLVDISQTPAYINNPIPNPATGSFSVSFACSFDGNISLALYGIDGKLIRNLFNGYMPAGEYEKGYDISNLSSGVYMLVYYDGSQKREVRLLIEN